MRSASSPDRLAGQQVVLRLRHAAQERPDHRRVIAGRHAKTRMAVNDLCGARRDRDIGHHRDDEARTDRRSVNRRNDGLVAVDHVVNQIARFAVHAHAHRVVFDLCVDQIEASTRRERAAFAAHQHDARFRISVDHRPDIWKFSMNAFVDSVEVRTVEYHFEHAVFVPLETHRKLLVSFQHGLRLRFD